MKKLFILFVLALFVVGCKQSSDSGSTDHSSIGDQQIDDGGGDGDWYNQQPVSDYLTLTGKVEAGPANVLSKIGALSVDDNFLMTGYVPGYIADNDGSHVVRGQFTGNYRFFDFLGTAYSEGKGTTIDNVRLMMFQPSSAEKSNVNNATTLRFVLAMKHYDTTSDAYYLDKAGSFIVAKSEIYDFFGFPNASKNFYEYSVLGENAGDAYLFRFELLVTGDREGPGIADYVGKMANAIYSGDLAFRNELATANQNLLIHKAWNDLKNEMLSRGFDTDPAPIWLTASEPYYTDLMTRTPTIIESSNVGESQCNIDVSDRNTFAYPRVFTDIETAKYLALDTGGEVSFWSVATCDNGATTFLCPGTKLLEGITELKEKMLTDPLDNMTFNGELPTNGLINGQQYFEVHYFSEPLSVGHACSGNIVKFGRNLATVDFAWNDSIGYNINVGWFNREAGYGLTD